MLRAVMEGAGAYLPERVVSNEELAQRLDTSDAWITERTGIRQRHLAAPHETAAFMGARAAAAALGCGGFGFDVSAACSGFVYGLGIADGLIRAGSARGVLVIGAEVYSRILDWNDRGTCVLFGDGAGAVFLRAAEQPDGPQSRGILSTHLHAQGDLGPLLYIDGAVGRPELSGHLKMNGREIFRHAVAKLSAAVEEGLAANGLGRHDVDWLVPHQANRRIIDAMGRKLDLPAGRVVVTVDRHANTSAASIPLALAEAWHDGRLQRNNLLVLEALGGGLTWGSALVRL